MVAAVLAVLQAGGAYLALDPAYPKERLAFMLEDSGAAVLLAEASILPLLPPFSGPVVTLGQSLKEETAEDGDAGRWSAVPPEALGYLIYTSDSTGRPKGVAMSRGVLANLLSWQGRAA